MDKALIIKTKIEHDDKYLFECLVAVYKQQDDDEQSYRDTMHQNGRGFNKMDAPVLSKAAQHVIKHKQLPFEEIAGVRRRMLKYANQLTHLINVV